MTRKTDSPRKRMRELLYRGPKAPPSSQPSLNEHSWAIRAREALTIRDLTEIHFGGGRTERVSDDYIDYSARAVRRLFEHFKLDPGDPLAWRWLVNLFAYAEFWEGDGQSGRTMTSLPPPWPRCLAVQPRKLPGSLAESLPRGLRERDFESALVRCSPSQRLANNSQNFCTYLVPAMRRIVSVSNQTRLDTETMEMFLNGNSKSAAHPSGA
jgi:hypothetical protein